MAEQQTQSHEAATVGGRPESDGGVERRCLRLLVHQCMRCCGEPAMLRCDEVVAIGGQLGQRLTRVTRPDGLLCGDFHCTRPLLLLCTVAELRLLMVLADGWRWSIINGHWLFRFSSGCLAPLLLPFSCFCGWRSVCLCLRLCALCSLSFDAALANPSGGRGDASVGDVDASTPPPPCSRPLVRFRISQRCSGRTHSHSHCPVAVVRRRRSVD